MGVQTSPFLRSQFTIHKRMTIIIIVLINIIEISHGIFFTEVHWTTSVKLSEYKGYKSITLLSFSIPERTTRAIWYLQGASSTKKCPIRNVLIYVQQGGYPVINPYNETFPESFYLQRTGSNHFIVKTINIPFLYMIDNPAPGQWFAAAFLPKEAGKKVTQKGLGGKKCVYGLSVTVIANVISNIQQISINKGYDFIITPEQNITIVRLMLPEYTSEMFVSLLQCDRVLAANFSDQWSCPLIMSASAGKLPGLNPNYNISSYKLEVISPGANIWNYIMVYMPYGNHGSVKFSIAVTVTTCDFYGLFVDSHHAIVSRNSSTTAHNSGNDKDHSTYSPFFQTDNPVYDANITDNVTITLVNVSSIFPSSLLNGSSTMPVDHRILGSNRCVRLRALGRFSYAVRDFDSVFVSPSRFYFPQHKNSLFIPDNNVLITGFQLWSALDSGGTLKLELRITDGLHSSQDAKVWMCLMKDAIPGVDAVKDCPDGAQLYVHTLLYGTNISELYIPYPEEGYWYLGLTSQCYKGNTTIVQTCYHLPVVEFGVNMQKCVEDKCGTYGNCEEYISGTHIFSSCNCYNGWRGYGCTDSTYAFTYTQELTSIMLLTLSNLFFIPGILLALRRRFFTEALVYTYTMFFSGFYHACDADKVLRFCIMKYSVMSYCDFYGSILSFWVTILAMAKISRRLRSFFHMTGAVLLVMGVEYDRHGLWVFVAPAGFALAVMLTSWVIQCKKNRSCYPSKKRCLIFLLPGVLLAATGLVIFAFLETDENYKFTHSAWHMVMALCILFLLPSGPKNKESVDGVSSGRNRRGSDILNLLADDDDHSEPVFIAIESPVGDL